jgi:hypothetical protein
MRLEHGDKPNTDGAWFLITDRHPLTGCDVSIGCGGYSAQPVLQPHIGGKVACRTSYLEAAFAVMVLVDAMRREPNCFRCATGTPA